MLPSIHEWSDAAEKSRTERVFYFLHFKEESICSVLELCAPAALHHVSTSHYYSRLKYLEEAID